MMTRLLLEPNQPLVAGPPPRGLFILFEGIDGAGKGTQLALLRADLEARFGIKQIKIHKEPSDATPLGREIRNILFHDPDLTTQNLEPNVADLLFLADHIQSTQRYLKQDLADGKIVLADRFVYSQIAYSSRRPVDPAINTLFLNHIGVEPDLLFFLYGDPELLFERANARPGAEGEKQKGKQWNSPEEFYAIQDAYLDLFAGQKNVHLVDVSEDTPAETFTRFIQPAVARLMREIRYGETE